MENAGISKQKAVVNFYALVRRHPVTKVSGGGGGTSISLAGPSWWEAGLGAAVPEKPEAAHHARHYVAVSDVNKTQYLTTLTGFRS